ncbi:hypothetical protein M3Y97_01081000 [Aphelenchoides bicaudatus]|nr:hypothetical protein M3Y97_01081000 [Aphelenchoides bicaudatus]
MLFKLLLCATFLFAFQSTTTAKKCLTYYKTGSNDTCESIAKEHGVKVEELEKANLKLKLKCSEELRPDIKICINGKRILNTSVSVEVTDAPSNRTALRTLIDAIKSSAETQEEDASDERPLADVISAVDV